MSLGYILQFVKAKCFSHRFMTIFVIQVATSHLRNRNSCCYQISAGTVVRHFFWYSAVVAGQWLPSLWHITDICLQLVSSLFRISRICCSSAVVSFSLSYVFQSSCLLEHLAITHHGGEHAQAICIFVVLSCWWCSDFSLTRFRTSELLSFAVQLIFSIFLHIRISNASILFARDSIYARRAITHMLSQFHLSVCLSHGWISQKRLKLGLCNFHRTVAPSL